MCFVLSKNNPDKLIAKEDITVWKVLSEGMCSPFQDYQYIPDELIYSVMDEPFDYVAMEDKSGTVKPIVYKIINRGLHAFVIKEKAEALAIREERGIKLYTNRIIPYHVYTAIIPKGSEYYINNEEGEIVSNRLIIKEQTRDE